MEKQSQIHFLPDYPDGMDDHNLEGACQVLVNEMMKTKQNASLVKKKNE